MSPFGWGLYGLLVLLATGLVVYIYRFREPAGQGRTLLTALRAASVAILILLLFDPSLPIGDAGHAPREWIAVDASLSMLQPSVSGSRWDAAVASAASAGDDRVIVFGSGLAVLPPDSLGSLAPAAPSTRLAPAVVAAAEAGGRSLRVFSDAGFEDATDASRVAARAGLDLQVVRVGGAAGYSLTEAVAPGWAEAGKPFAIQVGVTGDTSRAGPLDVVARQAGAEIGRVSLEPPAAGRVATGEIRFVPRGPESGGLVRIDLELASSDRFPDDDRRSIYVHVSAQPAGVALISYSPDGEFRFLLPVLEQALGVPVRGYLRIAPGRWTRVGAGVEAGTPAPEIEIRNAVRQADLLVLQGVPDAADQQSLETIGAARRLLHFPAGASPSRIGIALPAPEIGDWYPSDVVPASPVSAMLTGLPLDDLPPLASLRPMQTPEGAWTPLVAARGRRGATYPMLIGAQQGPRRIAVATGEGYWGWAMQSDASREVYRRLWSAVAGWLMQEERPIAAGAIHPAPRTVGRGETVTWLAPGVVADSLRLVVQAESGAMVQDTVLPFEPGEPLESGVIEPGHYRFRAVAMRAGQSTAEASGPFTVESYSPEFARRPTQLPEPNARARLATLIDAGRAGTPLHATPWPYLLLVMLLSAEWILRRRWGLR